MPLVIRPPSCWYCGTQLKWKDIVCPKCKQATPHDGEDWNKKKVNRKDG